MICSDCGSKYDDDLDLCPNCGHMNTTNGIPAQQIIGLLIGFLGLFLAVGGLININVFVIFFGASIIGLGLFLIDKSAKIAEHNRRLIFNLRLKEQEEKHKQVVPILNNAYLKLSRNLEKPDNCHTINVLLYSSLHEIEYSQQNDPLWYLTYVPCDCWVGELIGYEYFIIMATYENLNSKIKLNPREYVDENFVFHNIFRKVISMNSIHHFKVVGDTYRTTTVTGGEFKGYRGVSVNGIGFGEVDVTPIETEHNIHDNRFVALYYNDPDEVELQSIYFTYDSLETLIKLIPQFEQ